ncbi:MAG TPA: hypothetical protein VFJ48_03940, partial [Casimicrobiaceae bacterium]|nr:hypothetical protein [Casimicrobiaceae bacterium]
FGGSRLPVMNVRGGVRFAPRTGDVNRTPCSVRMAKIANWGRPVAAAVATASMRCKEARGRILWQIPPAQWFRRTGLRRQALRMRRILDTIG